MSLTIDLGDVDRFTVGTLGPVGQRLFLIQCRQGHTLLTLKAEKQQVAVIAEYLGRLLGSLERPGHLPEDLALEEPVDPKWAVGTLGVTYDELTDRIIMLVEEAVPSRQDADEGLLGMEEEDEEEDEEVEGDVVRLSITREQAAAFAIRATSLVEAGRPPCPLCGLPLDPAGHSCPRTNGHRPPIV